MLELLGQQYYWKGQRRDVCQCVSTVLCIYSTRCIQERDGHTAHTLNLCYIPHYSALCYLYGIWKNYSDSILLDTYVTN